MSPHSMTTSETKTWLTAVKASAEKSRFMKGRSSSTAMSISACPSIRPCTSLFARAMAACTRVGLRTRRRIAASRAIITTPPANWARVKRHPMSDHRISPSSSTRFVEANWNTMAAVKSPPRFTMERPIAVAA